MFKAFATSVKNELFNLFNNKLNQATENLDKAVTSFDEACKFGSSKLKSTYGQQSSRLAFRCHPECPTMLLFNS